MNSPSIASITIELQYGKTILLGELAMKKGKGQFELTARMKTTLSILISIHILAVIAEPFRFFSRSTERDFAPDSGFVRRTLGPYVDFMYLSHGYFFFAPNPGPSHLLESEIKFSTSKTDQSYPDRYPTTSLVQRQDNQSKAEAAGRHFYPVFPDRNEQKPRLLYHRHFMLSEFYHTIFAPPVTPLVEGAKLNAIEIVSRNHWIEDRNQCVALSDSIKSYWQSKYPTATIQMKRVEHALPNVFQLVQEHRRLTDPLSYFEIPDTLSETLPDALSESSIDENNLNRRQPLGDSEPAEAVMSAGAH